MTTDVFHHLTEVPAPRTGVIHVGAHLGQEVVDYRRAGFGHVVVVEPNPVLAGGLRRSGADVVHECACGTSAGKATLYVTAWDERSSLLPPTYSVDSQIVVDVVPLAELQHGCNWVAIDVQGSELDVLRSGRLDLLDAVIVETSEPVRYEGAATRSEVHDFLTESGYSLHGVYPGGHSEGIVDEIWTRSCES